MAQHKTRPNNNLRRAEHLGLVGRHPGNGHTTSQALSQSQVGIILDSYGFPNGEQREEFLLGLSQSREKSAEYVMEAYRWAAILDVKGKGDVTLDSHRAFFKELARYFATHPGQNFEPGHIGVLPGKEPRLLVDTIVSGQHALVPFKDLETLAASPGVKELASARGHRVMISRGYQFSDSGPVRAYYR